MQTEKDIESHFKKYGKKIAWLYYKQQGQGGRGKSDSFFIKAPGRIIFVEFKRPGKELTELQKIYINLMRDMGFIAIGVDSIKSGEHFFNLIETGKLKVGDDYPLLSSDFDI